MSIHDGQCDFGAETRDRCPEDATLYRDRVEWTFCDHHDTGGKRLEGEDWPAVALRYERWLESYRATQPRDP